MTIGLGILFQDRAFLCVDSCEYRPKKKQKFNFNATKYYKLSNDLFYIEAGLTNASAYIIKKLQDLKVDTYERLEPIISQNILSPIFNQFIEMYSQKNPDILNSPQFNYYNLIFAGRKKQESDLFIAYIRFYVIDKGKINYDYFISDCSPAMYTTLMNRAIEVDELYEKLKVTDNIKALRKACIETVEKLAKKSPYISPWGVFIELNNKGTRIYPFNSIKRICFLLKQMKRLKSE